MKSQAPAAAPVPHVPAPGSPIECRVSPRLFDSQTWLAVPSTSQPETALLAEIGVSSWMPASTGTPATLLVMSWPEVASIKVASWLALQVLAASHVRYISPSSDIVVEKRLRGQVTSCKFSSA